MQYLAQKNKIMLVMYSPPPTQKEMHKNDMSM